MKVFDSVDLSGVDIPLEGAIVVSYRGSIADGMYVPSNDPKGIDDIDLMGFVFGEPRDYFGLGEWGSRGTKEIKRGKYDVVLYEIRKAFSLLLQGNPNILSMLWNEPKHELVRSVQWEDIRNARDLFVGKHVYNAFAGYAHAQLEKMETRDPAELREYVAVTEEMKRRGIHPNHKGDELSIERSDSGIDRDVANWASEKLQARLASFQKKGENIGYMGDKRKRLVIEHGYDSKNAAHLIRLLRMCIEFMGSGKLTVDRPDAVELLSIKRGEWQLAEVKKHADDLFRQAREARDASTLPDKPNHEEAERLLISLVRNHFLEGGPSHA